MRLMGMVGDTARAHVGRRDGWLGPILVLGAVLVLGACTRPEPPIANWRTTTEPEPAPVTAAPPSMPETPMAPSMQVLPQHPEAKPAYRGPCLTKWGSPRLDAPPECAAAGPRASRAQPGRGIYKIGRPYTVAGRTYVPAEDPDYEETGIASWYGDGFHGGLTANGEIYDMHRLTAAHRTLPMPSYAYVHNPANGRTIMVRINNRGPFKGDRIIDLSSEAARLLDVKSRGLATVRVTYAGRAPLDGNEKAERDFLQRQPWYRQEVTLGH
jgi:rare lipoprotein A (peptidoglycan hydrolase)